MRFTALFLSAGLMGCPSGDKQNDSNETGTTDSGTYMHKVNVVIHAAIDGVILAEDPPAVCLHETEGTTGDEEVIATGETTEVTYALDVPEDGMSIRPWIGPSSAKTTADGYRIYERDGFSYIHELADFLAQEDCEETVELNVMPALEDVEYDCETTQYWSGDDEPFYQESNVHTFLAQEGQYFTDPDDHGIDGAIGENEKLMTEGTSLKVFNSENGVIETEEGTEVNENGFVLYLVRNGVDTYLDCTLAE